MRFIYSVLWQAIKLFRLPPKNNIRELERVLLSYTGYFLIKITLGMSERLYNDEKSYYFY